MPRSPWKSFVSAEDGREYLALLSYLPLNKYRALPRFFKYTFQVQRQLRNSKGLIGYSLDAKILSHKFWTLSVWEDEKSLMKFVRQIPHGAVMVSLVSDLGETKFTRWKIKGSEVPPDWNEARKRMDAD